LTYQKLQEETLRGGGPDFRVHKGKKEGSTEQVRGSSLEVKKGGSSKRGA